MSRYSQLAGVQAEYEPGSRRRVLRNLLGVKRKTDMDFLEHKAMKAVQEEYYRGGAVTEDTRFDASLICRMHKDWLGGIYEWAGEYRTVELEKGGFRWPPAHLVADNMARFEREILTTHTPCRPGSLSDVCMSIAIVHAELLLIHPFREGNGRLARWLASLMAVQAGLPPPFYRFEGRGSRRTRVMYLQAVVAGYGRRYADLGRFFEEAVLARAHEPA